jgi:flagellar biosynthetic protein FlhB
VPDDSGGEKTEEATPKKAHDARMDGQVAISQEVLSAALLLSGFAALFLIGPKLYDGFAAATVWVFSEGLNMEINATGFWHQGLWQTVSMGTWMLVFMGVMFLVALATGAAQVGLVFTLKPLKPKFSRINPISGLGRIFGMRGLMKFVFNLLKLAVIVAIAYWVISGTLVQELYFKVDLRERFAEKVWILFYLALMLATVLGVIATFDFLYQRWQHAKDQRMTKQEVREEHKQAEGDPLLKGKIRQIQRQMAQQRMMEEVPKADVVITNPTHVAVALRYDAEEMLAPIVVAKGYDAVAQRIKRIASENDVIQVENVPLARALAKSVDIGHPIPTDMFQAVAQVLSHVYKLKGKVPGSNKAA